VIVHEPSEPLAKASSLIRHFVELAGEGLRQGYPKPEPRAGHVVIQIKAFGINHAEMHMRAPGFPLSDVPLQEIAHQVAEGRLKAKPTRIFRFEEIREAHRIMEANEAGGKMVVVLD
jgi:NADPH:quinone reductase-like Zn-dependent oxidoreductase